ncbi:hypothetical protein GCM10027451_23980 [Geodermatophilus aquaeductus]|jgi:hypothetical protein|uniref:Immunoglobulin-like domain of spore germination n=1 Tax=Geodermatophilus aquaeductus TaxID=1564161 RepID=A0A521ACJ2_9ACTN|nr:hypothetical protein [Geodermatophilus aquaeductus]SMO32498.1 hypothetical protein SAMN06273567_10125 [Geodermatophilus aquaeductus]
MSASRSRVRRTAWAVSAALLVGPLAACSGSGEPAAGSGTTAASSSSAPASSGAATETASTPGPSTTDRPEPTDVATDAPVELEPGDDLEVVVSFASVEPGSGAVEASGYVPGLVEDGGRCTLVLSRAGRSDVSVEGEAFADAQSTSCALLSVPADRLAPGTWTARLDYRSDSSSGSSPDVEVVVP